MPKTIDFHRLVKFKKQAKRPVHVRSISIENKKIITRFLLVCIFILILIVFTSYLEWFFEHQGSSDSTISSFWDGIWWAIVTIATVGYGDKYPVTNAGRMVGILLILVGFTLLSVFTGLIAALFVEDKLKGAKGLKQLHTSQHIIICGWNKTAETLLKALVEKNISNQEICLVTTLLPEFFEGLEAQFPSLQLRFVRGEPTQEEILHRASISNAAQVIILADAELQSNNADDRSIIIANAVHYMAPKCKITVQLLNGSNKNLLHKLGIDDIIIYDELGGYLLANNIMEEKSLQLYNMLIKDSSKSLTTVSIPESCHNSTYGEIFDYFYNHDKVLMIGLISKELDMDIESIFTDNASAIDQFIKSTLANAQHIQPEEKCNIRWNPSRDYKIQETDFAIILS